MIIDIHAHAFPDTLAKTAVPYLEKEGDIEAYLDGTVASLITSMDEARVDASVVASIATKPGQFRSILDWSREIASDRLIPFPSVHPADREAADQVVEIKQAGFSGIKMHPYYQDFALDEERLRPILSQIEKAGLVLLLHTGFDLAFERIRIVDPERIVQVLEELPRLKLVTTHLGAWEDWDEVERLILGRDIYMDTAYSIPFLGEERTRKFLKTHPEDYLLFGTDSPWGSQAGDIALLRSIGLESGRERKLLGLNAARLLGLE